MGLSSPFSVRCITSCRFFVGSPLSPDAMARDNENWALAISPLVLAVGSQACAAFCATRGAAANAPNVKAAAVLFTKAFIKDLPDL